MTTMRNVLAGVLAVGLISTAAWADGMIVPVHPDIRVRGSWAVKYHDVSISVRDQVASVSVTQEFVNTGSGQIEVEYFFPVPPDAAIDSMTLMVDGKEFSAKLYKADEARKIYEDIVRRKKDPALLEYAGFGLIKTSAFPLEPGKPAKVLVSYKNVCKKDGDLTELWYPLNTEKFSARPIEEVNIKADVKAAADVTTIYSPSHEVKIERVDGRQFIARYHARNVLPTVDFQLFFKSADEAVGATLLTYQPSPSGDGYFLLLASPNPRQAKAKVVPKDVVVVFDRSGSMSSDGKIDQAREAIRYVLKDLNPRDSFNVIAFNDSVDPLYDGLKPVSEESLAKAVGWLDGIDARGSTDINEALRSAMTMCNESAGGGERRDARPKYVIFLTDGQPTAGKTKEPDILSGVQEANTCGARLFAFGVGYDVNVRLLDKLVGDNQGKSDYVKPKESVEGKVSSLYAKIKNPVMTNVKVRLDKVHLRDMYPRQVSDLFEGDQIVLVGRYSGEDVEKLPGRRDGVYNTQLVVTGIYEGKERGFEYPVTIQPGEKHSAYAFVEKLWAIRRVGYLLDQIQLNGQNKELVDELVRLSKQYGIMTPYTSFLADERTDLAHDGELRERAADSLRPMAKRDGAAGQMSAMNRQALNESTVVPQATAASGPAVQYGQKDMANYEAGKAETVANLRNVGNQSLYRRGQQWVTPDTAGLDAAKDADKIQVIERFSDKYFELARANSAVENQVMASQQAGEELLIQLRGQAYLIK